MIEDSNWLREKLHEAFGHGWQTHFARFLQLSGDVRPFSTIIRGISSAASGRHRLAGELRVLVNLLSRHGDIPNLIKEARRDQGEPMFRLLPKPEDSAGGPSRRK